MQEMMKFRVPSLYVGGISAVFCGVLKGPPDTPMGFNLGDIWCKRQRVV
jgi:hypothetical protein